MDLFGKLDIILAAGLFKYVWPFDGHQQVFNGYYNSEKYSVNPLQPGVAFLHPLKTSESL